MNVVEHLHGPEVGLQRRKSPRYEVQCRARIVIGKRHYAGYIHNISQGGAKLRTITPIRKLGEVLLRLPDLPALRCELRWTDSYNAGVAFATTLAARDLARWTAMRRRVRAPGIFEECEISEVDPLAAHAVPASAAGILHARNEPSATSMNASRACSS